MKISDKQTDSLFKAFGLFLEAFRFYVVEILQKEAGDKWPVWFVEALYPHHRDTWNEGLRSGSSPEALIDYQYLKSFALKYKDLLRNDFKRDTNKLATRLETIYDTRNKLAHFSDITNDEFTETIIQMKKIARSINMKELADELDALQKVTPKKKTITATTTKQKTAASKAWFRTVIPHMDIRQGRLDESIFAANLAEVALGNGREIYNNPAVFFSKTYFTAGLKNVAKTVIKGLNGKEDAENRVISLQTGFGGGKTHTLISLYHACKLGRNAARLPATKELTDYTGIPEFDSANIAVFTNTTTDAANGRKTSDGIVIQTIWGELAYQLGGKAAYDIVRKNDEGLIAPAGLFKEVLAQCKPALILIDELADYCVKASARKAGSSSLADQTISFMQELTEAVASTNNCVAVITLPASPQEVGNTPEAQAILSSLQKRVSRVGADTQPVADDEIYEVIRRRLFEDVGEEAERESVISSFMQLYQEFHAELPNNASKSEYKKRMLKSYPFHPELIDVFRIRWASSHDFQRTRGALRLLAAIVSDLWKRQQSLPGANLLIQAGSVNFANLDAMSGQLKKLYGNAYEAVITADVAGSASNAFKIDNDKSEYGNWYLTQGISAVILMNSFGTDGAKKGLSIPEIKLNLLSPQGFNHNNINGALSEMENNAYYLYYAQSGSQGKRYWFHTKPNINILINQAKADIKINDIDAEIIDLIKNRTSNISNLFNTIVAPTYDIPEQKKPTMVILGPNQSGEHASIPTKTGNIISSIATKKGNSDRIYRNTLLFLFCSEIGLSKLQSDIREYLAGQKISREYNSKLEPEQRNDLKRRTEDAIKQAESSLVVAYSLVAKHSTQKGIEVLPIKEFKERLDDQINTHILNTLNEEEWLLSAVGFGTLRRNNLIPTPELSIRTKDVYEAFLRFDDKPMLTGIAAINQSILKYCNNGQFCIAAGDGTTFTRFYFKENVPFFDAADDTYWLVDTSNKPDDKKVEYPTGTDPVNPPVGFGESEHPTLMGTGTESGEIKNDTKKFKSITISGKVPLEHYTQLFQSFILPLAQNNIEIEVRIKGKSTKANPIIESGQVYKVIKESVKQLGLDLEEEE